LRPRIYPRPAQEASAYHQRTGAPKPGDQKTGKRSSHLPRRGGLSTSGDRPDRGDEWGVGNEPRATWIWGFPRRWRKHRRHEKPRRRWDSCTLPS